MRANSLFITFALLFSYALSSHATFRFRINEDKGTLDWGNGEVNQDVVLQIMEGLTKTGPKGEILTAIAESWSYERSPASKIVFKIKKSAKWSDGKPVCAQHFVDAWRRVVSKKFSSPYAHYLFDIRSAKAVQAGEVDETQLGARALSCDTLVVELERETVFFPSLASHWVFFPIRKDLIEKNPGKWTMPEHLVVTGPYVLAKWQRDQKYVLKKNLNYAGVAPAINDIEAIVVSDDQTALRLFEQKKLDWIRDLPFLEKKRLSRKKEYVLSPTLVEYHLGFLMTDARKLTRDQRCALSFALNKEEIPQILQGGEQPATSVVPQMMGLPQTQKFDAAAAKKMWGTTAPSLEFHYYTKDIHLPLVQWMQAQWSKNLGVKIKLVANEGKTYWSKLQKNPPEMFLSGITAAYVHPYAFFSEFQSAAPANWGKYASLEYDRLAESADTESLSRAQSKLLNEDCAISPLYFRQTASLVSARVRGFAMNPLARVDFSKLSE